MADDISKMRKALFDTIEGLQKGTMKVETANAICNASSVLINSLKAEVEYIKLKNQFGKQSGFIPEGEKEEFVPVLETASGFKKGQKVKIIGKDHQAHGRIGQVNVVNNLEMKCEIQTNMGYFDVNFEDLEKL